MLHLRFSGRPSLDSYKDLATRVSVRCVVHEFFCHIIHYYSVFEGRPFTYTDKATETLSLLTVQTLAGVSRPSIRHRLQLIAPVRPGALVYRFELSTTKHPGIVYLVSHLLAYLGCHALFRVF